MISKEDLAKIDQARHLLPKPGAEVVGECIKEIRRLRAEPVLTNAQFRMLLNLHMVSDPWPLSPEEDKTFTEMLHAESVKRGFMGHIEAYHMFKPEKG
jgi:hypothetical protein